jgi:hypothetical protein
MANLESYRVNPKKFSLKDFDSNDKSERTGDKAQAQSFADFARHGRQWQRRHGKTGV